LILAIVGIWKFQKASFVEITSDCASYYNDKNEIILEGIIIKEPDIRDDSAKLKVRSEKLKVEQKWHNVSGNILITVPRYPEYNYGDRLKIKGKIKTPMEFDDFSYKDYLARDNIYSVIYWPEIQLIKSDAICNGKCAGYLAMKNILIFKNKFHSTLKSIFPEPHSSIISAMLLGKKRGIPENVLENFNATGTRHIVAISGLHITIMAVLLMYFALAIGFARGQAFYFSLFALFAYIILVGFPASAMRAGIMGALVLIAMKCGRLNSAANAVIFACAGMLFLNPKLLAFDAGFQLSFAATLGIIFIFPILEEYFQKIPNFLRFRSILFITLSAQAATLPIVIYNFHNLSLVAPLANVLIVPLVPFIMIGGLLSGAIGVIYQTLGWIISWPTWLVLSYQLKVSEYLSGFSFSVFDIEKLNTWWVIGYYILLGILILRYRLILKEK
jgi:competence protein ComEC